MIRSGYPSNWECVLDVPANCKKLTDCSSSASATNPATFRCGENIFGNFDKPDLTSRRGAISFDKFRPKNLKPKNSISAISSTLPHWLKYENPINLIPSWGTRRKNTSFLAKELFHYLNTPTENSYAKITITPYLPSILWAS